MYKPRPTGTREQAVFDFTLASRLQELSRYDAAAVVFICNDQPTIDSLAHLPAAYPRLLMLARIVNSQPLPHADQDADSETPMRCEWTTPEQWRRYALTDRWARITAALEAGSRMPNDGYLIMPAHDAVWGRGLLKTLIGFSQRHASHGVPAAVSPYTYYQHSTIPDIDIDPAIIDALNAAFARDSLLRFRFLTGRYQSYWGKMGMIPFQMCAAILSRVETMIWEDDLEIDNAIRAAGYAVRCIWVDRAGLYRQALPVFDRVGLYAVIERTLHYSLNLPGRYYGEKSLLNQPLDPIGRLHWLFSPRFRAAVALADEVTTEATNALTTRIDCYGKSWVDWGQYRYVVRVGDPSVQVWKCDKSMV